MEKMGRTRKMRRIRVWIEVVQCWSLIADSTYGKVKDSVNTTIVKIGVKPEKWLQWYLYEYKIAYYMHYLCIKIVCLKCALFMK